MTAEHPRSDLDTLIDLLVERVGRALTPEEDAQLAKLIAIHPNVDLDEFDRLAAAVELSLGPVEFEPLPAALRGKMLLQSSQFVVEPQPRGSSETNLVQQTAGRNPAASWWPWLVTAASLLLALWAWSPKLERPKSVAELRAELLRGKDVVQAKLADPTTSVDKGDLVWSPSRQQGYLRLKGLDVNDPAKSQYQLWIFDANQDDKFPIDGGVFNIDRATGDVIVPIHAALRVSKPVMFAVTVEKPGGVVVSSREQIKLLGKPQG